DGADVHVRFAAIEFFFSHVVYVLLSSTAGRPPSLRSAELRRDSLRSLACLDEARWRSQRAKSGADDQDRTGDLVLTKDALCQLSYIGLRLRPTRRPVYSRQQPGSEQGPPSPLLGFGVASRRSASPVHSTRGGGWSGRRGSNPRP